jgi:hypothetical protein
MESIILNQIVKNDLFEFVFFKNYDFKTQKSVFSNSKQWGIFLKRKILKGKLRF